MLKQFILLSVLALRLYGQADEKAVQKVAQILVSNGTNSTSGPDAKFCSKVLDGMQELQLRRSKFSRMGKKEDEEIKNHLAVLRMTVGPKSNDTDAVPEAHPELSNVALEGDMIMNPDQIDYMITGADGGDKSKRSVTTDPNAYWTVGIAVPYEIDYSLSNIRSKIQKGVQFWSDNSCLTFVENPRAFNRLRFYYGTGCFSYVGKQKRWDKQDISIGKGCDSLGTICHEMAHAMGFYHTQSRYDRDSYLYINYGNIQGSLQYNFDKQTTKTETHFNMVYDYGSVMQYPPYAFAVNPNNPTSVARDPNQQNMMGQRESPAFSDIKQMNILYKCADRCRGSVACNNNGIVNSKTCSSCICPRYFVGPTCGNLNKGNAPVCNGRVVQATSTGYSTLTATVGLGMTYAYGTASDCYWMIQAPVGRRIQIQVRSLNTNCMESCSWAGYEINMGDLDLAGMLICCPSIYSKSYTSKANVVVIRGVSRYNNANMEVNYRVV